MNRYQQYMSFLFVFVSFNSNALQCEAGHVEVDGVCVSSCIILNGTSKTLTYDSYIWGDSPSSFCNGDRSTGAACTMIASPVSISVEGTMWSNRFTYSGDTCDFDEINRYFGDTPSTSPFEGDKNFDGIPDSDEDWDGDGIVNSKDPNPTLNDSIDPDSDNNGIPDKLDPFFNTYQDSIPEIIYCDSESSGCSSYNTVLRNLIANNKNLVNLVNTLSVNDMEAKFKTTLENLGSTITYTNTIVDNKLTDVNSSLRRVRFAVEDNADLITDGFKDIADNFESLGSDITDINDTLYGVKNLAGMTYSNSRQIMSKIDNLSSNTPDVDLSGVENGMRQLGEEIKNGRDDYQYQTDSINDSIASLSNKIDGIEPTDLSGVETKLDDLIGGLTNDSPFTSPSSGFTGEGFLFSQNELSDLQEEVTEIKQEVTEEMDKFKTLFSIDTSSFNDGTFKEHSLNLRVNGSEQSFKSGVFTALLDNAAIISAVIMFLFVLSGIRMLGKD